MAEFKDVMHEYDRMCYCTCCSDCPIALASNRINFSCNDFMRKFPEEAECIIMKWAEEHVMTNGKKFEEVFGFALDEKCAMPIGILDWLKEEYKGDGGNG